VYYPRKGCQHVDSVVPSRSLRPNSSLLCLRLLARCRAPGSRLMEGFSLPATPSKAKPRRGLCSFTTLLVVFTLLAGELPGCLPRSMAAL
jgi:hypothetical protein